MSDHETLETQKPLYITEGYLAHGGTAVVATGETQDAQGRGHQALGRKQV